jgi:hypothetical protein
MMIGEDSEGNDHGLIKVLNWDLPGGNEKNYEKASGLALSIGPN